MSISDYFKTLPNSGKSVSINGINLEANYPGFRVSTVTGRDTYTKDVIETTLGDTGITKHVGQKAKTRDITISYALTADDSLSYFDLVNQLNSLLDIENAKYIFDDESNRYWIGTGTSISHSEIDATGSGLVASSGTITVHCADPNKYSTDESYFQAVLNTDTGDQVLAITNNGNVAVPINYEINNNHENGFIGIVSEKGVMQYGKIEEVDGYEYTNSDVITDSPAYYTWGDDPNWVADTGTDYENSNNTTQGTFKTGTVDGHTALLLNTKGLSTSGTWNGAMKTISVTNSSTGEVGSVNAYTYINSRFETGEMGQTGAQTIAFIDTDNKLICAQSIHKNDSVGNTAYVDFHVGGNNPRVWKSIAFEPSYRDSQNPFNSGRGHADMRKEGSKLTFHWWGSYPSIIVPELANKKVAKVQIWIGQWGARNLASQFVTINAIRRVVVRADMEHWKDVPNRYGLNDKIRIDGSETKFYLNEMARMDEEIKGSTYFLAEPGLNTVTVSTSSFCTPKPTITASIREGWL